ncbi:MAG: hypothetical protein JNJ77_20160 [Planctomycetia bacterium]|nr:hypothetical protein [Planctomycetia bacterium]
MIVSPRKQLQLSERQAHVAMLYHQQLSTRAISQRLKELEKADPKGKRGWGVSYKTVQADIKTVIEYYRQEAVDFYEDRLVRELMIADSAYKEACLAYEESRKQLTERTVSAGRGKNKQKSDEVVTSAPDPRFSVEKRKWQDQRLKLLGVVREMSKPSQVPAVLPEPTEEKPDDTPRPDPADLAPYFASLELYRKSIAGQSAADVSPESPAEPVHPV